MSVIAKVYARGIDARHNLHHLEAGCVCENELMAMYAPQNENVLFSNASPSGELRAGLQGDSGIVEQDQLYVIFTRRPQPEAFARAAVGIQSITDYGTTKEVKIIKQWSDRRVAPAPGEMVDFSFKIMIDNPRAVEQFKPGEAGWYVGLYRASQVTMHEALALAHKETD